MKKGLGNQKSFMKVLALMMALALFVAALPMGIAEAAASKDARATSITFKTTTGGDFVAGANKMKITFKLSAASKNVKLSIVDSSEKAVYTKTYKTCKKGKVYTLSWNGKNKKSKYVGEDYYSVVITAGKIETSSMDIDALTGSFKFIRKSGFAGGDGSAKNPYQVNSVESLAKVVEHNGQYFLQTEDIDMEYSDFSSMFSEDYPFNGSYDGGENTISNGLISRALFTAIGKEGEVKNVTISACNISGHEAAPLAVNNDGTVKNCKAYGCNISEGGNTKDDGRLGGLVTRNYGKIMNSEVQDTNISDATWRDTCGGLCSENSGNIIQCKVISCKIATTNIGASLAGGIVGYNAGTIINSSVAEDTTISNYYDSNRGAIAGKNAGVISSCTSTLDMNMVGQGTAAN